MFKKLVQVKGGLERDLELDIASLKPKGTEIIPLFQEYGLPQPEGGPRRVRANIPDRVILVHALTLQTPFPLPAEALNLEEAVKELYKALEDRLANRGRLYYAGAKVCWMELKQITLTPGNIVRMTWDFLRHREPDFSRYSGKILVQIAVKVLLGIPVN
jgi:hypothetical protein